MLFRLDLQAPPGGLVSFEVIRWHQQVGDAVSFGDLLCELKVLEKAALLRFQPVKDKGAKSGLLARVGRRSTHASTRIRAVVGMRYVLRASDSGVLRETVAIVGSIVQPGELIALFSTDLDEPLDREQATVPFRAAGDLYTDDDTLNEVENP